MRRRNVSSHADAAAAENGTLRIDPALRAVSEVVERRSARNGQVADHRRTSSRSRRLDYSDRRHLRDRCEEKAKEKIANQNDEIRRRRSEKTEVGQRSIRQESVEIRTFQTARMRRSRSERARRYRAVETSGCIDHAVQDGNDEIDERKRDENVKDEFDESE